MLCFSHVFCDFKGMLPGDVSHSRMYDYFTTFSVDRLVFGLVLICKVGNELCMAGHKHRPTS